MDRLDGLAATYISLPNCAASSTAYRSAIEPTAESRCGSSDFLRNFQCSSNVHERAGGFGIVSQAVNMAVGTSLTLFDPPPGILQDERQEWCWIAVMA